MTIVESVGWVLLHFVWQGAAIALALAVLLALTSAAQARLRYALSCAALTLMLAAALATAASVMTRDDTAARQPRNRRRRLDCAPRHRARRQRPDAAADRGTARTPSAAAERTASRELARRLVVAARSRVDAAMPWLVLGWVVGVAAPVGPPRSAAGGGRARFASTASSAVPDVVPGAARRALGAAADHTPCGDRGVGPGRRCRWCSATSSPLIVAAGRRALPA